MDEPLHGLLLAAGLSTRLGPLSVALPKPLLPVCNHPLLRWAVALCARSEIRGLAVNLHHLGERIRAELGDGSQLGVQVTYSPEPEILGTGGGIKRMAGLLGRGRCVVVNAKIVVDLDLADVLAFHRARGALATLVLRPDPFAERWGAIGLDEAGQVTRILEHGADRPHTPYQFTGIHVLEPELIDAIPDGPCCVIRTAYLDLLARGAPLLGYVHRGYFYDHSTPARYLQGNLNLLAGQAEPACRPGPLRGVDPSAAVDPAAELVEPVLVGAGARIEAGARVGPNVALGPRARVAAGTTLRDAVVWPDAVADASGVRVVVTPGGLVQVPEVDDPAASPR
jgi:mannose-1-phosphate guanylyltransferase